MMKPKISIITPVWNGMPYLMDCINSVLSQMFQDWEMLISDDGSTDGSRAILDEITDPRIKIFNQDKNLGIFGNLNFLMDKVQGRIVQVLCQDDLLLQDGLIDIIQSWKESDPSTSFIRHNWYDYHNTAKKNKYYSSKVLKCHQEARNTHFVFYIFGNPSGNLSNVSFNPVFFKEGVRFREDLPYAGDYEYWGRLGSLGPWQLNTKQVSFVRSHEGQASNYLNFKGELVAQQKSIKEFFFHSIESSYPKFLLKLRGSVNYFRFIVLALKSHNSNFRKEVYKNIGSPAHLHPILTLLLFILSFGGKLSYQLSVKMLIAKNQSAFNESRSDHGK